MIKLIIFLILSIGLVIWSWKAFSGRKAHGFYRFFAFESILVLVLVNADSWFLNPFFPAQIISWILLVGSIVIAFQGFYLLRTAGEPVGSLENTRVLVRTGVYKYIRHPLYCSLVLFSWGAFLKNPSCLSAIPLILVMVFAVATALVEERENLQRFGESYAGYMQESKRFLPYLF
jgi:protein-S-isoprenylcysteine O-methyltransferase Ste14